MALLILHTGYPGNLISLYLQHVDHLSEEISESVTVVKDFHDFTIGDLVWGQIRGFPSWPGKVVHETEVYDAEELEPGKVMIKNSVRKRT